MNNSDTTSSPKEPHWYAFISSLYYGHEELRNRLYDLGTPDRRIYVDEKWQEVSPGPPDKLSQADDLLRRVRLDATIHLHTRR